MTSPLGVELYSLKWATPIGCERADEKKAPDHSGAYTQCPPGA